MVKKLARYTSAERTAEIRRLMQGSVPEPWKTRTRSTTITARFSHTFSENATLQALLNAWLSADGRNLHNLTATTGQHHQRPDLRSRSRPCPSPGDSGAFNYQNAVKSAVDSLADTMKYVTLPTSPHRHAGSSRPPGGAHWGQPDRCKAAGGPGR